MRTLIDFGITYPQGIAVDSYRGHLYVADPSLNKLVRYTLTSVNNALTARDMQTVADNVEVRAVAVDGVGNVFFSDEPKQQILKVTAEMIQRGSTTAQVVYSSATTSAVSAPGGVAVDNYFVYWLNKAAGNEVGSVVRGLQEPSSSVDSSVVSLASNAVKCYGVCIALGNLFYSDEATKLYGVPRSSVGKYGEAVTISDYFQEPRGCAYDGQGTVYVADKTKNGVYTFAGNMVDGLSDAKSVSKVADLQGAFGVAVYEQIVS